MHVYLAFLAEQAPVPAAPVTIGPGAWLNVASNLGGLLIAVLTLLTAGRKWLGARVAEAATKAVEANVLPKLEELSTALDRVSQRLDEHSAVIRTTEQRLTDLVLRVDAHGRRLDEHSLRFDKDARPAPRTRRATT